jgi:hypothetical protein
MSPHHFHKQMINPSFAPDHAKHSPTHQHTREIEEKIEDVFARVIHFIFRRKRG